MHLRCLKHTSVVFARRFSTFSKYYEDGSVHTVSLNNATGEKSMLKLEETDTKSESINHTITNNLPDDALFGLTNVIIESDINPKQLQNDADQKLEQLRQRKMPAPPEEVHLARIENRFREYKWRPLAFETRNQCLIYAFATLPMHYAEAKFVLDELDRFDFKPETVLDFGSGAGGVFWAARQKWDANLRNYSMVDPCATMNHLAMDIMRVKKTGDLIAPYASFRKSIVGASNQKYDLVVAQRVLSEFDSDESRMDLLSLLWQRTEKYLVLIESNLKDHFKAIMQARDFLLTKSIKFDRKTQKEYLIANQLMSPEIEEVFGDKRAGALEEYRLLKSKNIKIPTELEIGHVVAPCPHDNVCPMKPPRSDYNDICSHMVKYREIRTDGRNKSYKKSGLLRSFFTYIIFQKGERPVGHPLARILKKTQTNKCVHCTVCTSFEGLQRFSLGKRAENLYHSVKRANEGCLLPAEEKIVASDSDLHFVREMIEEAKKNT